MPTGPRHRAARSERGATLVFVALLLVALIGMASLVIDLGNGWLVRRSLVPASDSAALAAAQRRIEGHTGQADCDGTAAWYVAQNAPGAVASPCDIQVYDNDRGRITVTASDDVETWLAGVLGKGDFPTSATSSVAWGPPAAVTGLRPLGLCIESSAELAWAVVNGTSDDSIYIDYDKWSSDDCGDAAGNWAFVDFDGGYDSTVPLPDLRDWVLDGYPAGVEVDPTPVSGCASGDGCLDAYPGSLLTDYGISWRVDELEDERVWVWLPVFDHIDAGTYPARMHVVAVVRAQILSFPHHGHWNDPYLRLRVEPGLVSGTCCGEAAGAAGNKVTVICGVDTDPYTACDAIGSLG